MSPGPPTPALPMSASHWPLLLMSVLPLGIQIGFQNSSSFGFRPAAPLSGGRGGLRGPDHRGAEHVGRRCGGVGLPRIDDELGHALRFDDHPLPKCPRQVVEQFTINFLPPKRRAFIAIDDLGEECGGEIFPVFVSAATNHHASLVRQQALNHRNRARRGRNCHAGIAAEAQAKQELVKGVHILPRRNLITDRPMILWTA